MPTDILVRVSSGKDVHDLPATIDGIGYQAADAFAAASARHDGVHVLLRGSPAYSAALRSPVAADAVSLLTAAKGQSVLVIFPGRTPVRRRLVEVAAAVPAAPPAPTGGPPAAASAVDLTEGRAGAAPLWLTKEGAFAVAPGPAPKGADARDALVNAARWVSSRRTSTFERLFPPSPFHPEAPPRTERLTASQADGLLAQVKSALAAAGVGSDLAKSDATAAAQIRSACFTVLSHVLGTVLADASFRAAADAAAATIFDAVAHEETDPTARASLRAHGILLLQLRGAALSPADQARAATLLQGLLRVAPPYDDLKGPWRFAMCSDVDFHAGECQTLVDTHGWKKIDLPAGAPQAQGRWGMQTYEAYEAPFKTPSGDPIQIFARTARPDDENLEMGVAYFYGVLINRHAQLGSFDLKATSVAVQQHGYKVMMNSQCAGLTTRFTISRMFPDADLYSSWDSTYFRTDQGGETGKIIASEGQDCFVALLQGMSHQESHAQISDRIKKAQWSHEQARSVPDFVQFVGPAFPLVVSRFNDVNRDGRADCYDGFLDFYLKEIAEDIKASLTPRDPGVTATQVSGEAAAGLDWASGSMDRVTQYSDLWSGLPGASELLYAFQSGGFYSQREPPEDVPAGQLADDPGKLPAVCRYRKTKDTVGLQVDVMFHSWLGHAGKELKRLLVAADALWRAFDLGHLSDSGGLATLAQKRGMLLLTLAGLLEFPADQNYLDGLWSMALKALRLPDISRSLVRDCITEEDHDASNYYGSKRGLPQLLAALQKQDALAYAKITGSDPTVGRAAELDLK